MKKIILAFAMSLAIALPLAAQQISVSGKVVDEKNSPLSFVNVYIKGTVEGSSTDEAGHFSFWYQGNGEVTLCASMLGYDEYIMTTSVTKLQEIVIKMRPSSVALDNVVVVGSSYMLQGNSRWNKMSSVDMATGGGFNGDLYGAIQLLPGTQAAPESGELQVRGGDGRETQTYIDDMHVLFPYTTSDKNGSVRGRYSPFMFEGINFAAGGYSQEYANGLSAVLPLYTKDKSEITKLGIAPSIIGVAGGGTKAFDKGSLSLNMDYWDKGLYDELFPDRVDWIEPYRRFSGAGQFRYSPTEKSTFKTYINYDRTTFKQQINDLCLALGEDNIYLNTTFRTRTDKGWDCFVGAAFSFRNQRYMEVRQPKDAYQEKEQEIHLKAKASKRVSSYFRLNLGMESFIRSFHSEYRLADMNASNTFHPLQAAGFVSLIWNPHNDLFVEVSSRGEYNAMNHQWNITPRVAVNYDWNGVQFSAIAGRYTQLAENKWMQQNKRLESENCTHYILGMNYAKGNRIFRAELYYKEYDHLAWENAGIVTSGGYGRAKGIDLFYTERQVVKNLDYTLSYSYGDSKRKYGEYGELTVPPYATLHNAAASIRFTCAALKTIWGLSDRFASGRPYHHPGMPGIMNARVKPFNSLDLSVTYLASPKVLVYASASNVLCRQNVYGKQDGRYIRASGDHFFFVGVFITLSGKTAYDVSNF